MCLHKLLLALSLFWTVYDQENSNFASAKFASKLKSPNTLVRVNDVLIIHRHKFHELTNIFSLLIKSVYKANPKSPQNSFKTFKASKVFLFGWNILQRKARTYKNHSNFPLGHYLSFLFLQLFIHKRIKFDHNEISLSPFTAPNVFPPDVINLRSCELSR